MPQASISSTSHTVTRSPRTQGCPDRWPGTIATRERSALSVVAIGHIIPHSVAGGGSRLFVLHDGHVAQIAVELVGIEAEAHHEAVGDLEAAEVHRNLHDAARVAVQESAYRERIRRPAGQGLQQVAQGEAGIDDILYQEHVLAFDA